MPWVHPTLERCIGRTGKSSWPEPGASSMTRTRRRISCRERYLSFWKGVGGGTELPVNPRAFLLGCLPKLARNDRERRRRRARLLAASDPPRVVQEPARAVEAKLLCERILAGLSPSDAQVLRMRYLDEFTTKAIAERLGTTPGAVRVRLHRSRRRAWRMSVRGGVGWPGKGEM